MSHPEKPRIEQPSTYFVQDRASQDEKTRLSIQDEMLTIGMGGVLSEQADPSLLRQVLDVGCATGGWLLETAQTYPQIETLVGVDISDTMLSHARAMAEECHLEGRVQFKMMDAFEQARRLVNTSTKICSTCFG
jgi:tRNA1(Val) A37 N6-methylase TrmN6